MSSIKKPLPAKKPSSPKAEAKPAVVTTKPVVTTAKPAAKKVVNPAKNQPVATKAATKTSSPPAKPEKPSKAGKPRKQKMVRDSFTMPEEDYSNLTLLKKKCLETGLDVKKSELLRAGLAALSKMSMETLAKALGQVEKIKTGRPKK